MMKSKMRVFCWFLSLFCAIRTEERLVVTGADMPVFAYAGEDVVLNCSVDTHVPLKELKVEWIKTNGEILVLLFSEGENRPESQQDRFRGRAEFFSEEIPKGNFSLKLRDVKSEDRGEFMCKVHTDREAVNATAWLQEQGFSTLHLCVLGLTIAAAAFAVISCIPALWYINKERQEKIKEESCPSTGPVTDEDDEDESCPSRGSVTDEDDEDGKNNRAVLLYCLQVSVPCILMSIAFAIWGYIESSIGEAYVGSTINLMRILVIFKVAPYTLPGTCYARFTNKALRLEKIVITTGVNSILLHKLLASAPDAGRKLFSGFMFAAVLFKQLTKDNLVTDYSYYADEYFELDSTEMEMFFLIITCSAYGFSVGLFSGMVFQLMRQSSSDNLNFLLLILGRILYVMLLITLSENDKEYPALLAFIVFLHILMIIQESDRWSDFSAVPHILVYAFGSAVLSVLNSVALATEVILKAENGERTVDLRLIIFPLESFFLACLLVLQKYA